ncbi:MAG: SDR family oxidoreductase [Patescibacteria group bacterium]
MDRIKNIPKTNLLKGKRIIITGCGFKELNHEFYDVFSKEKTHDSLLLNGKEMKINIGAAIAFVLVANGAIIHMVSQTKDKLEFLKKQIIEKLNIPRKNIEYSIVDLLNEKSVNEFSKKIKKDKPIYWIQSIGLGAGAYKIKDDNPYLHIKDIPSELLERETTIVLKGTHLLMQKLLPIFEKQNKKFNTDTRIAIISSMSAIRGYASGGTHCAAKGAISRYTNSAMLDLWKDNIYITDIRPGAVDTGFYDNKFVQKAVLEIDKEYGSQYSKTGIKLAPPISIANIVNAILIAPAHTTSINLVARGQLPNEGS